MAEFPFYPLYNLLIASSFFFLSEQLLLLIIMYKDKAGWKFRFARAQGYPNLRPVQATALVALVIFIISLVSFPIISYFFFDTLVSFAESLKYGWVGLPSLMCGAFFFIWHYIVGKNWNKAQYGLVALQVLLMMLVVILNVFQLDLGLGFFASFRF